MANLCPRALSHDDVIVLGYLDLFGLLGQHGKLPSEQFWMNSRVLAGFRNWVTSAVHRGDQTTNYIIYHIKRIQTLSNSSNIHQDHPSIRSLQTWSIQATIRSWTAPAQPVSASRVFQCFAQGMCPAKWCLDKRSPRPAASGTEKNRGPVPLP